jgi:hypothetical protein
MRKDGSGEHLEEDLPPDDPPSKLERLDAGFEDLGAPDENPPSSSPLSSREIDDLVDQVVTEELARLGGSKSKQ